MINALIKLLGKSQSIAGREDCFWLESVINIKIKLKHIKDCIKVASAME